MGPKKTLKCVRTISHDFFIATPPEAQFILYFVHKFSYGRTEMFPRTSLLDVLIYISLASPSAVHCPCAAGCSGQRGSLVGHHLVFANEHFTFWILVYWILNTVFIHTSWTWTPIHLCKVWKLYKVQNKEGMFNRIHAVWPKPVHHYSWALIFSIWINPFGHLWHENCTSPAFNGLMTF